MNVLFLIGIAIFLGAFIGKVFQRLKVPQVVGYIIIGVLLGKSVLGIWSQSSIDTIAPLIHFTLGIIGFMIGSELKMEVFRKYGHSIYTILISEGMLAFILVTISVTLITKKLYLGLLLGAIASATDPASTVNVLWEYKTKGPLTTTLTSIVALDDGLALILYGLVSVFCKAMIARESFSFWHSIATPLFEIFQCFLLGIVAGVLLTNIILRVKEKDLILAFTLGGIALLVGLSDYLQLDLILSSMVFGAVVVNIIPKISGGLFRTVKENSTPLSVFFFSIIGASLDIHIFLKVSIIAIILTYLMARSAGKVFGAMLGGFMSRAKKTVGMYTGMCLFTQGGVAMGLAMSINHNLSYVGQEGKQVGVVILSVVAATTFVVQLVGPILVKLGVTKADETGRDITKEDIIESYKVSDVMQRDFSSIKENATLKEVIMTIKERESYHFPVVDKENRLVGLITLGELRGALLEEGLEHVILAKDVAEPVRKVFYPNQPLKEVFEVFDKREVDYLAVVKDEESQEVVGILEYHPLIGLIERKVLERRHGLENNTEGKN